MTEDVEQILATATVTTELIGQGLTASGLYFTAVSGYLLAAYFIGKDLGRLQAAIITVVFVSFTATTAIGAVSFYQQAVFFGNTYGLGHAPFWPVVSTGVIQSLGILVALKFMWDVRHPKE